MDRTTMNALTRTSGAIALTALLLYAGMALERAQPAAGTSLLLVVIAAALAVAGLWGLGRLDAHPAAPWVALLVLGAAPVVTFVGWVLVGDASGVLQGILWLNLLAGLATSALVGWWITTTRHRADRPYTARVS